MKQVSTLLEYSIHLLCAFETANSFSSSNVVRRLSVVRQGYKAPLGSDMFHILPERLYGAFVIPKHSRNESVCLILACNDVKNV